MFEKIQGFANGLKKRSFALASVYYLIASIISQGTVLLSTGVFTRMMSKEEFGLVSTFSTCVLIANTFIGLNLFITVRNAYVDYKEDFDSFNSSILLLCIFAGIGFTAIFSVASFLLYGLEIMFQVVLICVQSIGLNLVNLLLTIQAMKMQYRARALLLILPNCFHILLSLLLMVIFPDNMYFAKIFGNASGIFLFGMIALAIVVAKCKPKIILEYWKYALTISVPAILHTLSDLILMQCDRLMLTWIIGAEETAEYSIVYNVGSIIVILYQAINGAWIPWFYGKVSEGKNEEVKKYQGLYMLGFTLFTCFMITISPEIIKIISAKQYWGGIEYVFPIILASYVIFLYSFFATYLLYKKQSKVVAFNTLIASLVNLALNYVLIPHYKSGGAVMATLISYVILFMLHLVAIRKEGRQLFSLLRLCENVLVVLGYGIVFMLVKDSFVARYLVFVVFGCLFYVLFLRKKVLEWKNNKNLK